MSSPSTLEDSDEDPDYTPTPLEMETSSDENSLVKRRWLECGVESDDDSEDTSREFHIPTWLLPNTRQHHTSGMCLRLSS